VVDEVAELWVTKLFKQLHSHDVDRSSTMTQTLARIGRAPLQKRVHMQNK